MTSENEKAIEERWHVDNRKGLHCCFCNADFENSINLTLFSSSFYRLVVCNTCVEWAKFIALKERKEGIRIGQESRNKELGVPIEKFEELYENACQWQIRAEKARQDFAEEVRKMLKENLPHNCAIGHACRTEGSSYKIKKCKLMKEFEALAKKAG